jgi:hypothetical protein
MAEATLEPGVDWWELASCRSSGSPEWWDEPEGQAEMRHIRAVAICVLCPVRENCLQDALSRGGEENIRAGLYPKHQREILRSGTTYFRILRLLEKLMRQGHDAESAAFTTYTKIYRKFYTNDKEG